MMHGVHISILSALAALIPNALATPVPQLGLGILPTYTGDKTSLALASSCVENYNSGISLSAISSIVAFGDSYTFDGNNLGEAPPPATLPTLLQPNSGGRVSNGPVWTEWLVSRHAPTARLYNYATSAATSNQSLYTSTNVPDFGQQSNTFLSQKRAIGGGNTMYVVYFGINDNNYNGTGLPLAAESIFKNIRKLQTAQPACNILLIGAAQFLGGPVPAGAADYSSRLSTGLKQIAQDFPGTKVAYVNFNPLYSAIEQTSLRSG